MVFGGALVTIYALYRPFENWTYVRFLLPGLSIALALAVMSARASLRRTRAVLRVPLLVALAAASLGWGVHTARELNLLELSVAEARYVTVARYVAHTLPERSAIICVLYSGSLRYYAQRETLRFDGSSQTDSSRCWTGWSDAATAPTSCWRNGKSRCFATGSPRTLRSEPSTGRRWRSWTRPRS